MIMFNPMTKKKVYCTVPLTRTVTHTLTHDKIIKRPFNKNNVATDKSKKN